MLDDTRSSSRPLEGSDPHERQFLVGNDDDDDDALADEVRSFSSSASMDDDDERDRSNSLMNNARARMSHLSVHEEDPDNDTAQGPPTHRGAGNGGLAAKAGIILVRSSLIGRHVFSSL